DRSAMLYFSPFPYTTLFRSVEDVDVQPFETELGQIPVAEAGLVVPAGVDGGRDQVVGGGDGVDVAGQVEVELVHRHHLAVPTAGGTAFDPERRAHRRLADAGDGLLADVTETLGEPDSGGGLPLPQRSRGDGGDHDVLAPGVRPDPLQGVEVDLRLGVPERNQLVFSKADPLGDFGERTETGRTGDVDVAGN